MARDIAILGFGFSGLMVAAQLVSRVPEGTTVYIIATEADGRGLAYSTRDVQHRLNVPAGKMGAYPDHIDDFLKWLATSAGAVSRQDCRRLGLELEYNAQDFVPRRVYGDYLSDIWRRTQEMAVERGVIIKLVPTRATAVKAGVPLTILTERGDAIAVWRAVLATGHETKPILPHLPAHQMVQNPWEAGVFEGAAHWQGPIALMGVGLTAVDVMMHVRGNGYTGEIIAFSRHGLLPQAHRMPQAPYHFTDDVLAQKTLRKVMRFVRKALAEHVANGGDWRAVVDGLRPHTQALWKQWNTREQQRFLRFIMPIWGVHRHRMAPDIAARMQAEIAAGTLRVIASPHYDAAMHAGLMRLQLGQETITISRIINCTGPQMDVRKSNNTLLRQAVAEGVLEPHANGLGVAVDHSYRAWGDAHPHLYVIGPLMTGQWLESTAVPELRVQALHIAKDIAHHIAAH